MRARAMCGQESNGLRARMDFFEGFLVKMVSHHGRCPAAKMTVGTTCPRHESYCHCLSRLTEVSGWEWGILGIHCVGMKEHFSFTVLEIVPIILIFNLSY
jgi:hypothetical protein